MPLSPPTSLGNQILAGVPTRRADSPRWWADLAGCLAGASLLIVTALWVHHGGVHDVVAGGWEALIALGRLTGLLASDLMLLQVLLLARIPLAERAWGQDRLTRWHRWVGFTSFHLMLAHIVLVTVGYAGSAHQNAFAQFWSLVVSYPGMLLATAATGLLVMVVITSIRAARRRLRYESWHLLHLYAYLGVGLALPHQVWTGADFIASAAARGYWWTLYAVCAGSVIGFRIGLPAWRSWLHRLEVSQVVPEAPGIVSIYLRGRQLDRLGARAGQFFQWRFLDGPGWTRAHPYSLSAPPRPDQLRITVKNLGDGSSRAAALKPGTRVLIEGPYGRLTGDGYDGRPVTMIGCGIGVTPLLALLWELPYRPGSATLLYRARTEADLAFRSELAGLAVQRGVRVLPLLGPRGASGPSWLPRGYPLRSPVAGLREIVPDIGDHHLYVCGPDAWMTDVVTAARQAGVPADRIHSERFSW